MPQDVDEDGGEDGDEDGGEDEAPIDPFLESLWMPKGLIYRSFLGIPRAPMDLFLESL